MASTARASAPPRLEVRRRLRSRDMRLNQLSFPAEFVICRLSSVVRRWAKGYSAKLLRFVTLCNVCVTATTS